MPILYFTVLNIKMKTLQYNIPYRNSQQKKITL